MSYFVKLQYKICGWNGGCDFGLLRYALTEDVRIQAPSLYEDPKSTNLTNISIELKRLEYLIFAATRGLAASLEDDFFL